MGKKKGVCEDESARLKKKKVLRAFAIRLSYSKSTDVKLRTWELEALLEKQYFVFLVYRKKSPGMGAHTRIFMRSLLASKVDPELD